MTQTSSNQDPHPMNETNSTTKNYHSPERFEHLTDFIEQTFNNQTVKIDSLPGDASFRRYHRVTLLDPIAGQDPTYIVMDAPPQLESVERFVSVDLLLATKVNVPTLIAKDISKGFLILQDFGGTEFADLLATQQQSKQQLSIAAYTDSHFGRDTAKVALNAKTSKTVDDLYKWAIDDLLRIQTIKVDLAKYSFNTPDYDSQMLQNEMALFNDWFLPYIKQDLTDIKTQWETFTNLVVAHVLAQPQVLVHRDYHSRNLMLDQYHPEALGIIDFQDAVIGPYTYDLVSLVRDAYVDWDETLVQGWIEYFWTQTKHHNKQLSTLMQTQTLTQFISEVMVMGVQRHLKVLGIFVRLAQRDGKTRYLADIPKVWRDLMLSLNWLQKNGDDHLKSTIAPVYHWFMTIVQPNVEQVFQVDASK